MYALSFAEVQGRLEFAARPDPRCPPDGVVLRVEATGVCRSDWHAWMGHDPVALPHVPGHEFAGIVAEVGPQVRNWRVGDKVTAPFVLACGQCEFCRAGDGQVCPHQEQPGFTIPGSFAELVALPRADFNLVAVPDGVDSVAAAALGCRFATSYRAVTGPGRVRPEQWVAVFGCGGVGLSAVMIAAARGARVIGVDPNAEARRRATGFGAVATLDPAAGDVATAIADLTGGGAHVGIDALGSPRTAWDSVRSLRRRGRHVQVGLLLGDQAATPLPMDLLVPRELTVVGSHGMAAADYPAMLGDIAAGRLDPARLVGATLALADGAGVFAALDSTAGRGTTVLLP